MKRFVLLDRDGTIIEDRNYLADPEGVALLPGAAEGLRRMQALGLGLAVITNQSGIGRGLMTASQVAAVHERLKEMLASAGVKLDGIYFCPHAPDEGCACRKPATGLVRQAERALGFDARNAFVIGDKPSDVALARNLGAYAILVCARGEEIATKCADGTPDATVENLTAAATWIAQRLGHEQRHKND